MNIKIFFALAATIMLIASYYPYIRDILSRKTAPHAYTWLIWSIMYSIAATIALYGGGGWGVLSPAIGALLNVTVFILSLKYGTRNIKTSDRIILLLALLSIVVWMLAKTPVFSVFMVTAIDAFGYIPTLRKSWEEPWSETLSFWLLVTAANILSLLALGAFNWLTATYLIMLTTLNALVSIVCIFRRNSVPRTAL